MLQNLFQARVDARVCLSKIKSSSTVRIDSCVGRYNIDEIEMVKETMEDVKNMNETQGISLTCRRRGKTPSHNSYIHKRCF